MEKPPEQPWENRCAGCFLLPAFCICEQLPRLTNRIPVTIIRHVREHRKSTNTARLARQVLSQCKILDYGDRDYPLAPGQLPESGYLLFPEALDSSGKPDPNGPQVHDLALGPPADPCQHLILLDGTWSQARRMSHRIPSVARLPRLSFSHIPARPRLRRPPTAHTSATLEALAYALGCLENHLLGDALLQVFDTFVEAYYRQCDKPPKVHPCR